MKRIVFVKIIKIFFITNITGFLYNYTSNIFVVFSYDRFHFFHQFFLLHMLSSLSFCSIEIQQQSSACVTRRVLLTVSERNSLNRNIDVYNMFIPVCWLIHIHFKRIRISWNIATSHNPLLIHVVPCVTILIRHDFKMPNCI